VQENIFIWTLQLMYSVNCRPTRVIGSGNAQHENAEENVQQYVPHSSDPQQFVPQ
jgi:hypothetical protein